MLTQASKEAFDAWGSRGDFAKSRAEASHTARVAGVAERNFVKEDIMVVKKKPGLGERIFAITLIALFVLLIGGFIFLLMTRG